LFEKTRKTELHSSNTELCHMIIAETMIDRSSWHFST